MFLVKPSIARSSPANSHQSKRLRGALRQLAQGMRELEEQLPLPADRLVRHTTPAQQKATALRIDIEDFNLRLTRISRQIKAMNRVKA